MAGLFALTLLVSAGLLFAIQPMVGRMLLPKLGGSPAVWNTCLVFFQGMLLFGYLYSHLLPKWLGTRRQAFVHVALLALVFFTLPPRIGDGNPTSDYQAWWLLKTLLLSVGVPFLALSTTNPLWQEWYALRRGRDPYFLSMASNTGSLALLVAYPLIIEPRFDLEEQSNLWKWGFCVFFGLTVLSVLMVRNGSKSSQQMEPSATTSTAPAWRWVLLAFIPSSLLSGVTNSITTDVAPIPLLWVVPLALYLVTFIIAFAPIRLPINFFGKASVLGTITLALAILAAATEPLGLVLAIHLAGFFSLALLCHSRLSLERPAPHDLTRYYLLMSLGGVLGGAFNALVAPALFHRFGFVEYPLMIVAACLMRPAEAKYLGWRLMDFIAPMILGAVVVGMILLGKQSAIHSQFQSFGESTGIPVEMIKVGVFFGLPLIVCFLFVDRPVRFALGIGAVLLASHFHVGSQGKVLLLERNFLGVVKVTTSTTGEFTMMVHGNTVHGQQRNAPRPVWISTLLQPLSSPTVVHEAITIAMLEDRWDDRHRPLTYYHPNGPAGTVFRYLTPGWKGPRKIAAVGLGTGALASYARPNEDWTFFELDPAVEQLARDDRYFTFLKNSRAKSLNVIIGDARITLDQMADGSFDLLVLDAFSSDAIPLHLLTMEAFEMYRRKLAPNGVILMHLSNRYLDLPPMMAKVVGSLPEPMVIRQDDDLTVTDREREDGKFPSSWVIIARHESDFGPLQKPIRGWMLAGTTTAKPWTDRRANLMDVLRRFSED